MHHYLITIVDEFGGRAQYRALFASSWDAIDGVLDPFFTAARITARRVG